MTIEEKIEKIKAWGEETKIKIIEGDYKLNEISEVNYPSEDDENMDDFLNLVKNISPRFLVLDTVLCHAESLEIFKENIELIKEEDLEESLKNLEKLSDEYLGFCCFIFTEGIVLRYNYYLDEADDYISLNKIARRALRKQKSIYKEMSQQKADEFGREFAEHSDYFKLKNRTQRESLAIKLYENLLKQLNVQINYGVSLIVSAAEIIFETEIKPRKEKELKVKITDYLSKGWTKVKIAAELGISKDTLNKYV